MNDIKKGPALDIFTWCCLEDEDKDELIIIIINIATMTMRFIPLLANAHILGDLSAPWNNSECLMNIHVDRDRVTPWVANGRAQGFESGVSKSGPVCMVAGFTVKSSMIIEKETRKILPRPKRYIFLNCSFQRHKSDLRVSVGNDKSVWIGT